MQNEIEVRETAAGYDVVVHGDYSRVVAQFGVERKHACDEYVANLMLDAAKDAIVAAQAAVAAAKRAVRVLPIGKSGNLHMDMIDVEVSLETALNHLPYSTIR